MLARVEVVKRSIRETAGELSALTAELRELLEREDESDEPTDS